jgi:SAM-dependent methyltransferase
MSKTIALDEEGYFLVNNGTRVTDNEIGHKWLKAFRMDDYGVTHLDLDGDDILVEAFDKPYVVSQIHIKENKLVAQMPYQYFSELQINSFCLDDWDRFHALTINNIPVVFTRKAQAELFNLAQNFTDDNFTILNQVIDTPPYYLDSTKVNKAPFWNEKYEENPMPNWNLDQAHPELKSILQQIKLNKMRVMVAGCGYGHDAAYFALQGHIVTAVNISPIAIAEAKKKYGHIANLTFKIADVFNLDSEYTKAFDLVFEHTCFCAISPNKRDDLIKVWKNLIDETGHILGIFFVVPKRNGPYFGSSEWELREKLEKNFKFFYWTRLKHSPSWRNGAELMIYAQIRS